jgi:hypothetical protein
MATFDELLDALVGWGIWAVAIGIFYIIYLIIKLILIKRDIHRN